MKTIKYVVSFDNGVSIQPDFQLETLMKHVIDRVERISHDVLDGFENFYGKDIYKYVF